MLHKRRNSYIGDVNDDGVDDFFVGVPVGKIGCIFVQSKSGKLTKPKQISFENDIHYEDSGLLFLMQIMIVI